MPSAPGSGKRFMLTVRILTADDDVLQVLTALTNDVGAAPAESHPLHLHPKTTSRYHVSHFMRHDSFRALEQVQDYKAIFF